MAKALNPAKLVACGVILVYEEIWSGKPGVNRKSEPDPSRVANVFLGLTPEDWCRIAMREGDSYIGGCCGTASAMQDIINGIYRDGGYADATAMYSLGEFAKIHPDGFEKTWNRQMSQKEFDAACKRFSKLRPWDKIALSWQAVRGKVKPYKYTIEPIVKKNRPDLDARREIDELLGAIHYLHYSDLFRPKDENTSAHPQDVMAFAQLYPGAKRLVAKLEADYTVWKGFAIVEKDRPEVVVHNGRGACLYKTNKEAQEMINLWQRDDRREKKDRRKPKPDDGVASLVRIRPITISVRDGISFGASK